MIAVIAYELNFDVDRDSDSAHIYADADIDAVYYFEDIEQAREYMPDLKTRHPGARWRSLNAVAPAVNRAELDKYQMRMKGDWS